MEPEKHDSPFQRKKTTCQPTNQSKPANSCETPTPDDSETSTVNPVCQPTNPYENTNSNPGRHCPPTTEVPLPPAKSKTSELQNHSGGRKTRLHAHRARRAGPDTRHETSHAIPIPHHLHQIGNADIEKISTSRRWKRSPTIWRHGEPVPMRNVANTMRRSRGWRHPEPD